MYVGMSSSSISRSGSRFGEVINARAWLHSREIDVRAKVGRWHIVFLPPFSPSVVRVHCITRVN